jgi:hypothetical protein
LETGAVQETTDWPLPFDVAETAVGAPGVVAGVAGAEATEAALWPSPLVALTVKVYGVPLVRPLTVQLVPALVQVKLPGDDVTVYPVMVEPPVEADAVHDTTELALAFDVALTPVGAEATVAGVTLLEAAELALLPAALVASTVNV